ncbi:hypothetical protein MJM04_31735, partial [Salmonella enterica subsp. enterica serovar Cerro]|nr:hypothetical protein [Salmonella enterica subsp. enterica serovar Cerro]
MVYPAYTSHDPPHPESQDSVANRVLLKPAIQHNNVTVHDLYARYPDFFIDTPY